MRVADAVRKTSGIHRLKVGEKFVDTDGNWEVTRAPEEAENGTQVKVYVKPFPHRKGQRSRGYLWHRGAQVKMLRK